MCDAETDYSRSHGIKQELIVRQAEALGIPLIQPKPKQSRLRKKLQISYSGT